MISSTANVEIPGGEAERRISGSPTMNAQIPPTIAATASEVRLPVVRSESDVSKSRHDRRLLARGTDKTPAVQAPSATKLMWPKDSTPELPMKT